MFLLSAFSASTLFAQKNKKITITGSVVNAGMYPISNATVMIDGHSTKSFTNASGKYKIKVSPTAKKIGIVSFEDGILEEDIDGRTRINFQFSSNLDNPVPSTGIQQLPLGEESVNTGYIKTKRKYVSSNTSKVDCTNPKFASYSSVQEIIQREVSGVRIINGEIIIHGSKNMYDYVPPLVLIDDVPSTLSDVRPSEVESIEVIKDGTAAIYGTRAYGGVILITTRK